MVTEALKPSFLEDNMEMTNNFRISDVYEEKVFDEIFNYQLEIGNLIKTDYSSNVWTFYYGTRQTKNKFNFTKIHSSKTNSLDEVANVEMVLKAWVLSNIDEERSIESLKKYFDYITEFLLLSDFFSINKMDVCRESLMSCDDRKRWNLCIPTLNLLDFLDNSSFNTYYEFLINIKNTINLENVSGKTRSLPNVKDVLNFSKIVDTFESNLVNKSTDYYSYFPIILWWKLGNIIPMRPSEFVSINKKSLSIENNKHYIKLPRIKLKKNSRRIQIVSKIAIPEEIYTLINGYLSATSNDSERTNLFSVKLNPILNVSKYIDFNYTLMSRLLSNFYENIASLQYNGVFNEKVRLNDTRHFAFINLMRQGYHPVEIARLGGHTSLQAQYHYQQHLDYWVEFESLQLLYSSSKAIFNSDNEYYPVNIEFILDKVLHPIEPTYKGKLKLGYCTDSLQRCRTKRCITCLSWGIDIDEFKQKRKEITLQLKELENGIDRALSTLKKLYEIALNNCFKDDNFSNLNPNFQKDLYNARLKLDEQQQLLTKFQYNILKGKLND
ncbi:site-specific integrase [Viridibacillus arvi]|uniref:site-specific integrase n=1 Tax=Viridibacillus arvi TaxID=263475 RepID=UPI003D05466A